MVRSLRNALIGLLSLSVVGCANTSGGDVAKAGFLAVALVGIVVAMAALDAHEDDEQDAECKKRHKHCDSYEHRKNHEKCN